MPNTKSAIRRMRGTARKKSHNRSIQSRLRSLEKDYLSLVTAGKLEDASKTLRDVSSALDKAAKVGVIHKATADRKKSRLSLRLLSVR